MKNHQQTATEAYRVAVDELSTILTFTNGTSMNTTSFLRPSSQGTETIVDRLNDPNMSFVAFRGEQGVSLVQVDFIAAVRVPGRSPEVAFYESVGAVRFRAGVRLASGKRLIGDLIGMLPPDRSRLSDLLNGATERFLLMVGDGCTYYLNRKAIQQVEPLAEISAVSRPEGIRMAS
ncbi:MAG TPA: hypothetical protein VE078_07200 [Thermoanaerobaculia bacterium]|nr:hypothetical protein [Thermoanaerobaculia bacterium]